MDSTTKHRRPQTPMSEQIKLINECRRSGLTAAELCRKNQISPSTFYTWIKHCRKAAQDQQLIEPRYEYSIEAQPKQDVIPVSIIQEQVPEKKLDLGQYSRHKKSIFFSQLIVERKDIMLQQ